METKKNREAVTAPETASAEKGSAEVAGNAASSTELDLRKLTREELEQEIARDLKQRRAAMKDSEAFRRPLKELLLSLSLPEAAEDPDAEPPANS